MKDVAKTKIQLDPSKLVGFEAAADEQKASSQLQSKVGNKDASPITQLKAKVGSKGGIKPINRIQAKVGAKLGRKPNRTLQSKVGAKIGRKTLS